MDSEWPEYIIVVGTDKDDSPLAAVFATISEGFRKNSRVYLVTEDGSREWNGNEQSPKPSVEFAKRVLTSLRRSVVRLLLFDASSPAKGGFKPNTGLFAWASQYRFLHKRIEIEQKVLDEVLDFFDGGEPALWWAGLVGLLKTEGGGVAGLLELLAERWEEEMKGLDHDERNEEAHKRGRRDER